MNNFFTQFKNKAREIKLSQGEKQAMRMRLYTYLENNPAGAFAAPATDKRAARLVPSPFFFFSPRFMVPVALLLMVGLGSGTAFAAQDALPGNPLYAIKINVNERVATALATTPAAKASVNAQLATTRLEEAETLAANGKLDANATAALASNFTAHAKAVQAVTQDIAANDPGTAAQLGANFNSTLAAHGAILTEIGQHSKSDETMQNSNSLAIAVEQETDKDGHEGGSSDAALLSIATAPAAQNAPQNGARIRTFAAVAPTAASNTATSSPAGSTSAKTKAKAKNPDNSGNPNDAKIAASLSTQASTSIAAMGNDFAALQLDPGASAQLSAQINDVKALYAAAAAELAAGNASQAAHDFASVIRTSVKLDAYFKVGKKINIKLLSGLLSRPEDNSGDPSSNSNNDSSSSNAAENHGKGSSDEIDVNADLHL